VSVSSVVILEELGPNQDEAVVQSDAVDEYEFSTDEI